MVDEVSQWQWSSYLDMLECPASSADDVLDRCHHREAYQIYVFLLRRVCNMSLKEVATIAEISQGRVSQIQKMVSEKRLPDPFKNYKV